MMFRKDVERTWLDLFAKSCISYIGKIDTRYRLNGASYCDNYKDRINKHELNETITAEDVMIPTFEAPAHMINRLETMAIFLSNFY